MSSEEVIVIWGGSPMGHAGRGTGRDVAATFLEEIH